MQLPNRIVEIVATLNSRNATLSKGTDDQRRQLTHMIQEQIVFEFGSRWGGKVRAGLGDENMGKDSIGYQEEDNTVSAWDWQNGETRESTLRAGSDPDYPHLSPDEARFIPRQGVNHLGADPVPVDPQPPAPSGDLESQVKQFLPAAAHSLDVLHVEQRLVGVALGCMDDQGNPTYVSELQVIKNQLVKLVDRPPADSPTVNVTPEMIAAVMPLLTQVVTQVASAWMASNNVARITVTPLKK